MDRAIWASWYDLPEDGRDEYLEWMHSSYLPSMLDRPGYLWAAHVENIDSPEREAFSQRVLTHTDDPAVPDGFHYLLLFGAADAHVFADPSPDEMLEAMSGADRAQLAMRSAERSAVYAEIARVDAPEARTRYPGITPGPVVQFGTFNINAPENELELSTWYSRTTFPIARPLAGMVGARRLVSISGWPRHGILYEFTSLEGAQAFFDAQGANRTDWNMKVVGNLIHAPHSPTLGTRIWPPAQPPAP